LLRAQLKIPALGTAVAHGGAVEDSPRHRCAENRAEDYEDSAKDSTRPDA
jgi:hypothetical protein